MYNTQLDRLHLYMQKSSHQHQPHSPHSSPSRCCAPKPSTSTRWCPCNYHTDVGQQTTRKTNLCSGTSRTRPLHMPILKFCGQRPVAPFHNSERQDVSAASNRPQHVALLYSQYLNRHGCYSSLARKFALLKHYVTATCKENNDTL
ncbi:hypothetical protein TRVL_03982 [Trypanosoma vivax]|nr:hypothetical protein TRVL_03982 [Trypanosoma vivax]